MEPFVRFEAIAVPMEGRNLDTNQLCPTRFNKFPIGDPDYPRILFHNQRFGTDGTEIADFILNREPFRRAGIMVGDENFGCGSSRESAVYALLAFGIRSVLAPKLWRYLPCELHQERPSAGGADEGSLRTDSGRTARAPGGHVSRWTWKR